MFRPVDRRALSSAREGLFLDRRVRIECLRRLTKFAAASAVLWLATTSFAVTANAAEANVRDDTFSALRDYVQVIDTGRKSIADAGQSSSQPRQESADAAYAALRAFTERIGVEQPALIAGLPKLAEADNLLDFLRDRGSSTQPAAKPKESTKSNGPAAGGRSQPPPSKPRLSAQRFARPAMRARPRRSVTRSWAGSARRKKASLTARIVTVRVRHT